MGLWNNHGMSTDDETIQQAIYDLGLTAEELGVLVEHARKESWVWTQVAEHQSGQQKRKSNLIAKHLRLRMEKWIDLTVQAEVEYESEYGAFKET